MAWLLEERRSLIEWSESWLELMLEITLSSYILSTSVSMEMSDNLPSSFIAGPLDKIGSSLEYFVMLAAGYAIRRISTLMRWIEVMTYLTLLLKYTRFQHYDRHA